MTSSSTQTRRSQASRLLLPILPLLSLPLAAPQAWAHEGTTVAVAPVVALRVDGLTLRAPAAPGTVRGRVVDETGQPVGSAQVSIVGTTLGALADANGDFVVRNVPEGTQTVRVSRIGFAPKTATVVVPDGGDVTINFSLAHAATRLAEVVTTATGQTERTRETGASVAVISDSTVPMAAVNNLSQTLNARAPGISVSGASGALGTTSRIRIRGSNSISLNNDPLLVVDGVRVNASNNSSSTIGVGGQSTSRFEDINPEEIETITVLKGPAASALYGTAAANGVIQITTKRGRSGKARWNVYGEAGNLHDVNKYPSNYQEYGTVVATGKVTRNCNIDVQTRGLCTPDSLVVHNPIELSGVIRDGSQRTGGLSVTGGSQNVTYFIASELNREQGVYDVSQLRRLNLRTNLTAQVTPSFDVTAAIGYINSDVRLPQNDNDILGAIGGGLLGSAEDCGPSKSYPLWCYLGGGVWDTTSRGYYSGESPQTYFGINTREQVARTLGSLTANWTARPWLTFNGVLGGDISNNFVFETWPANISYFDPNGYRDTHRTDVRTYTVNGSGTATHSFLPTLQSSTTLGVQYNEDRSWRIDAFGDNIIAGSSSLEGTNSNFSVGESYVDNKILGFLGREQLTWRDRLYLTGALRTDKNSAQGQNFGWILYPALNASWVVSDEPFFPEVPALSSLRLRAGWGVSGQRPSLLSAINYYRPVSVRVDGSDVPGFTYGTTQGNPDLKPEKSSEVEGGFDMGLVNDRVSLEYTHYNKNTTDALVSVPLAPSVPGAASQWRNLAKVHNWGDELGLRANIVQGGPVEFDLNANFTWQQNRLIDLGRDANGNELPTIFQGFSSTQRIQKGYPLGSYFVSTYTYSDKNGDGIISRSEVALADTGVYYGTPFPTREMNFTPVIRIGKWAQVQALIDYKGGQKLFNSTAEFRCSLSTPNCQAMADPTHTSLADQAAAIARRVLPSYEGYIEDASFTKLREVAVTLRLPQNLAQQFRAADASLTLAGRNLHTWTNYTGLDPEVNALPTGNFSTADFLTQPQVRYFTARLSFTF